MNRVAARICGFIFFNIGKIHIYYIEHSEASQMNRVVEKICGFVFLTSKKYSYII
jgi:hypothetical protein